MYQIDPDELLLVHDLHPQYVSTAHAAGLPASSRWAAQHHRAHIASVLAERGVWDERVIGVSFDGTGYGDDSTIWGGELFAGNMREGFQRVSHLRSAVLPGGDAAASNPVQAAAGFLSQLPDLPDLLAPPFSFPARRYRDACQLVRSNLRCFGTTSVGRLFDTAAALLGFTREITFEGQAAMWLENLAKHVATTNAYPFPFSDDELDFRPLLAAIIRDRLRGGDRSEIARAFQRGIAEGLHDAVSTLCHKHGTNTVALSGGVFQNELLLSDMKSLVKAEGLQVWTNHAVPPGDGGISLGQAAIAAMADQKLVGSLLHEVGSRNA